MVSFAIPYRTIPATFPMTAPKTGIGISTSPKTADTALTVASKQNISEWIRKSSSLMTPAFSLPASASTPNTAETKADATAAGVAVKLLIPYTAAPLMPPFALAPAVSIPSSFQSSPSNCDSLLPALRFLYTPMQNAMPPSAAKATAEALYSSFPDGWLF